MLPYSLMEAIVTADDLRGVELLDTSDVAVRLDLSASPVAQLAREGRIAAVRTVKRASRVPVV